MSEQSPEQHVQATPTESVSATAATAEFKALLQAIIPDLRAFARGLIGRTALADDLVQEALLKAWSAQHLFQPGTNFKAWCFVILRNLYMSFLRRQRFWGEWDESVAERVLSVRATQGDNLDLIDLQRALMQLPKLQREAVLLVGASGVTYEEAAEICKCAVGTIRSRVNRARTALDKIMTDDGLTTSRKDVSGTNAMADIFASAETIRRAV